MLVMLFAFFCAIPVWFIGAASGFWEFAPLIAAYGVKVAGELLLCGYGVIRNNRAGLLLIFPLAELAHIPYLIGITLTGIFGTFEWRGRRTKNFSAEYCETNHD